MSGMLRVLAPLLHGRFDRSIHLRLPRAGHGRRARNASEISMQRQRALDDYRLLEEELSGPGTLPVGTQAHSDVAIGRRRTTPSSAAVPSAKRCAQRRIRQSLSSRGRPRRRSLRWGRIPSGRPPRRRGSRGTGRRPGRKRSASRPPAVSRRPPRADCAGSRPNRRIICVHVGPRPAGWSARPRPCRPECLDALRQRSADRESRRRPSFRAPAIARPPAGQRPSG